MLDLSYSEIIDISPLISEKTAVFPGDKTFERKVAMDFDKGHHFGLSSIDTTVHIGAHTDAPNHYHQDGSGIEKRNLELYMGKCQVLEVALKPGERILPHHIEQYDINTTRVLFKTNSFTDPNLWHDNFNSLSPELVDFLGQKGVKLVGIDTPSVDPSTDKDLLSHKAIYKADMAVLEGILLEKVDAGEYILMALPLKLKDADASPVRAILLK